MKIHENLNGWRLVAREMVKIMKNLGGKIMKNHYKRHENHESCRGEKIMKRIMKNYGKKSCNIMKSVMKTN